MKKGRQTRPNKTQVDYSNIQRSVHRVRQNTSAYKITDLSRRQFAIVTYYALGILRGSTEISDSMIRSISYLMLVLSSLRLHLMAHHYVDWYKT